MASNPGPVVSSGRNWPGGDDGGWYFAVPGRSRAIFFFRWVPGCTETSVGVMGRGWGCLRLVEVYHVLSKNRVSPHPAVSAFSRLKDLLEIADFVRPFRDKPGGIWEVQLRMGDLSHHSWQGLHMSIWGKVRMMWWNMSHSTTWSMLKLWPLSQNESISDFLRFLKMMDHHEQIWTYWTIWTMGFNMSQY